MKYRLCTIILFLSIQLGMQAQEITIEAGKSITSFDFQDILFGELESLESTNQNFIEMGYRGNLFGDGFQWVGGLSVHSYGAIGNDQNNYLAWETTYLGLYAGVDIPVIRANKFSFHLKGIVAPEFMVQGTQTLNNRVMKIVGEEDFDTPFLFLRGAASFEYKFTDTIGAFFQYRFGRGSQMSKSDDGAELDYTSNDFGLGLIFSLANN